MRPLLTVTLVPDAVGAVLTVNAVALVIDRIEAERPVPVTRIPFASAAVEAVMTLVLPAVYVTAIE